MPSNVAQEFVEVGLTVDPEGRVSQEFAEVFLVTNETARVSQLFVEVFLVPGSGGDPASGFIQGVRLARMARVQGRRLVPRKDYRE